MINSIEQIIAHSGDSQLLGYDYASGVLTFKLRLDELDCVVQFRLSTKAVVTSAVNFESLAHSACRIRILRLDESLALKNGVYVPSEEFGSMMKELRDNLHLAYGFRSSEAKLLLQLVGHTALLACPFRQLDEIEWSVVEN